MFKASKGFCPGCLRRNWYILLDALLEVLFIFAYKVLLRKKVLLNYQQNLADITTFFCKIETNTLSTNLFSMDENSVFIYQKSPKKIATDSGAV